MSKRQNEKRRRIFVDPRIQSALLLRVILYWVCCLVTATGVIFVWSVAHTQPAPLAQKLNVLWQQFAPGLIVTLAVLPLAIHDIIKVSNRFVGPIVRFRNALRRMADGEQVEPIQFREGDFWHDLTDAFNANIARLQEAERRAAEAEAQQASACPSPELTGQQETVTQNEPVVIA